MSAEAVLSGERRFHIGVGDVRTVLRSFPDACAHVCVTSPPYWRLRDYGVPGQIGLEGSPEEFVDTMVEVFQEVRRVLRPDGTLWLNLGDSYVTNPGNGRGGEAVPGGHRSATGTPPHRSGSSKEGNGLKTKDLVGMPWRVAFALRQDGWYLRSSITWCKLSPMPEPVKDRPTSATDMIFLLSKQERYWYDADAVREPNNPANEAHHDRYSARPVVGRGPNPDRVDGGGATQGGVGYNPLGRNMWNYWLLASEPYPEAHFAVFPSEVPRRTILAGTSEGGCCSVCGAPYRRVRQPSAEYAKHLGKDWADYGQDKAEGRGHSVSGQRPTKRKGPGIRSGYLTTGWVPSCKHGGEPVPCVVLDPFSGAATTGVVALQLGRRYLGCELNPAYAEMSERRILRETGTTVREAEALAARQAQLRMFGELL